MFVAALLVLLVAVLLLLTALFTGGDATQLGPDSLTLKMSASGVFFLGMVTLLLFVLAIGMMRSGAKRASARRRDRKKVSELSSKLDEYKREEHDANRDTRDRDLDGR